MDGPADLLRYELKNRNPVSASAYAEALMALDDEFVQFMALHVSREEQPACRMMVGSVRDGSIISDLFPVIAGTIPLLEAVQTAKQYADYLKAVVAWMLGGIDRPAIADERKTLKNISNIVRPMVNDKGAQMNIGSVNFNGTVNVHFNVSEPDARSIIGFAKKRLADTEKPTGKDYEGVVFYWAATSSKLSVKAGDKGMIDDICDRPVSVAYADESIKRQMVLDAEFIYRKAYLVDVRVHTAHDGKIALYTIKRLIEVIDLE